MRFLSALESFLQRTTRIHSISIIDGDNSFLFHPQLDVFEIFRFVPNVQTVTIGGGIRTIYPDRPSLEKLIQLCPNVRKFSDQQAFGITLLVSFTHLDHQKVH
jgi:hypothetical protein